MATNFSVQLQDATNIVPAPVYNPGPSPLDPILQTLGQGISQFRQDMDERARKKKEAEAKRDVEANNRFFDLLSASEEVNGNPLQAVVNSGTKKDTSAISLPTDGSVDPRDAVINGAVASGDVAPEKMEQLIQSVKTQAEGLRNMEAAIAQGSVPSGLSRAAAVDRAMLQIRQEFPDVDMAAIAAVAAKFKVDDGLFNAIRRDLADEEALNEATREATAEALKLGTELAGTQAGTMSEGALISLGMQYRQNEMRMEETKRSLEIAKAQGDLTESQIALAEKKAAGEMGTNMYQQVLAVMGPRVSAFNEILRSLPAAGADPAVEEQMAKLTEEIQTEWQFRKNEILAQVLTSGVEGAPKMAEDMGKILDQMFEDTFLTPLQNRDTRTANLAKKMEDLLGLNTAQAYPVIAMMKQMGLSVELNDALLASLDPEMRSKLGQELAGIVNQDIFDLRGRSLASIQLAGIVSVLNGNKSLNDLDWTPAESARAFRTINRTAQNLTPALTAGNFNSADAWLNAMATIAVQTEGLSPASNTQSLINAGLSLAASGGKGEGTSLNIFRDLIKGKADSVDPEHARAVALGSRAGIGIVNNALVQRAQKDYGPWSATLNEKTGKWEMTFDEKAYRAQRGPNLPTTYTGGGASGVNIASKPAAPAELRSLVSTLNMTTTYLVESAEWDENAPQATKAELRKWYTQGIPPKSMIEAQQKASADRKDDSSDVIAAIEKLRADFREQGGWEFELPTRPGPGGLRVDPTGSAVINETQTSFATAAKGAGFSDNVVAGILANVQHESGFDVRALGDSGSAKGFFQHRLDRAEKFEEITGAKPEEATPQQAIQFFKWELDNPEAAGMTQAQADAIKNASSPEEAAMLIQKYYERPKVVDPRRGETSRLFYDRLGK